MRRLVWLLCVACFCSVVVAQEKAAPPAADDPPPPDLVMPANNANALRAQLTKAVEQELEILQRFVKLDEQAIAGLKLGIQPAVEKAAKEYAGNVQIPVLMGMSLPPELRRKIHGAAGLLVKDKDALKSYEADAALRSAFQRKASIVGFVAVVDQAALLLTDQVAKVEKVAGTLHDSGKLSPNSMIAVFPGQSKPGGKALKEVLTPQQYEYWEKNGSGLARQGIALSGGGPDRETRKESLTKELNEAAAVRMTFLKAECGLSEKQVKQLQLAAKGAIKGVLDLRLDAEDDFRQSMQDGNPNPEAMNLAMMDAGALLDGKSRWPSFVIRVLDDEQKKQYQAAQTARERRAGDFMATYLIVMMGVREVPGGGVMLTGKQQLAVHDLFADAIETKGSMQMTSAEPFKGLLKIPEEKFVKAMGEENWRAFQPLLDQLKSQFSNDDDDED